MYSKEYPTMGGGDWEDHGPLGSTSKRTFKLVVYEGYA